MMSIKNKFFAFSVYTIFLSALLLPFLTFAEETSIESIASFDSQILVNKDNSVEITEVIKYNSGPFSRHGLLRDIYPYSSEKRKMDIKVISVADEKDQPYIWTTEKSGSYFRIKIGDPNVTWQGQKTYKIAYLATNAVSHLKNIDEIYWNVTGTNWNIPIMNVSASVYLPDGVQATQSACYYGREGTNTRCDDPEQVTKNFVANSLSSNEGMTIAVGFPKGIISDYSFKDNFFSNIVNIISTVLAILLPTSVFLFMFLRWKKYGRDPKGRGTIIAEYDVPDNLTPLQISAILNQYIKPKDISGEIIYLAVRGYLKIRQIENKVLGIFKSTDYEFTLLKDLPLSDISIADAALLEHLIGGTNAGSIRKMSDLNKTFYKYIPEISNHIVDSMLVNNYYSNLSKSRFNAAAVGTIIYIIFFAIFFFFGIIPVISDSNPVLLVISLFASVIIFAVFNKLMPAKTEKGVLTKEYILGFKEYLQIAEKDRLAFHNAPEKKPEVFEKFLPYAMVLGVDKAWAKEFEDIYLTPPAWFETQNRGAFNAVVLNNALSDFRTASNTNLASAPGGSGGSGSVGGGGGGGGGGGW